MNAIDLFSGCGGLSRGFEDAGFNIVLGIDNDDDALTTFKNNHQDSHVMNLDLFNQSSIDKIRDFLKDTTVDLIIAGPPCQGFSLTGPRKLEDPRNKLYLRVLELIELLQPKAFVIENVPGMATLYEGKVLQDIKGKLEDIGYDVNSKILLAAQYGVPQMRRRLFIVGTNLENITFEFPDPMLSEDQYISCEDAIGDLPPLPNGGGEEKSIYDRLPLTDYQFESRKNADYLYNHVGSKHTQKIIDVIKLVPDGGNHKDLPEGIGEHRKFNEAWTRYNSKKPSKTIDTGHRNHFHYKENRVPTVRENARLQSFPDDFVFSGSRTSQYRQVGNAVPPLLGYHLATSIRELIGKEVLS